VAHKDVLVGNITDVDGEVNIAGGDIYKGLTAEQVSTLLTQITATFQPKVFDGRCPYKGLDVFEEEDAELFFGREKTIDDLVERVRKSKTVFITGPSGNGKSSLVRAGLIPKLKQGGLMNSERWLYETVKPGRDPLEALALAFSRLKSPEVSKYFRENVQQMNILYECSESVLSGQRDQHLVLFIDQFEEIFTQVSHEEVRQAFLDLLTHAAMTEDGRIIILFAMRSDFVSNCATYPRLNALLNQEFVQIGAMGSDELVSAIAQPALRVGLRIDPDLIVQIIDDMEGEPGALPLMQFALKDLFDTEQIKGGIIALTREAYLKRGGIQKSLERHANTSFAKLEKHEQALARSIFGGLIEIGRGTQDTRRTAIFDELIPSDAGIEEIEKIVRKLADARLITTDELAGKDLVTISHEKLIDAWPWLKKLVDENRDVIALQNQIATDAKEWEDKRRDTSYLYTGARLANAQEQLDKKKIVLSGLAQKYIAASSSRQKSGQRFRFGSIVTIMISLIIAVIVFINQSNTNQDLARRNFSALNTAEAANKKMAEFLEIAQANRLFAEINKADGEQQVNIVRAGELTALAISMRDKQPIISMLLSLESFNSFDNPQTRSILISYLTDDTSDNPLLESRIETNDYESWLSPDGNFYITRNGENSIFSDVLTGQPIGPLLSEFNGGVDRAALSPDGKLLASAIDSEISLWDLETGKSHGQPLSGHGGRVASILFSPDGMILASVDEGNTVILWDITTHLPIGNPIPLASGHIHSYAEVMSFSPDSKFLALNDGKVLNLESQQLTEEQLPIEGDLFEGISVDFSPDGKTIALGGTGSRGGIVILFGVSTNQILGQIYSIDSAEIMSLAFSLDGKMLASGGEAETVILWDAVRLEPIIQPLYGGGGYVESLIVNSDGKLISRNSNGVISAWDLNPYSLYRRVCTRAGRNFSQDEWKEYFSNEEYRKTCEEWPAGD